jgi:hypothetical protein
METTGTDGIPLATSLVRSWTEPTNTTSTNPTSTDRIQHATLVAKSWTISLKHGRHLLLQLLTLMLRVMLL